MALFIIEIGLFIFSYFWEMRNARMVLTKSSSIENISGQLKVYMWEVEDASVGKVLALLEMRQ